MELQTVFEQVQSASRQLTLLDDEAVNRILLDVADAAEANTTEILAANAKDLARMDPKNPKHDRLKLTVARIQGIASDIRNVATLPSPVGRVLAETVRPNGMSLRKVAVPFGVIGIIYEARPNVSFDVFSLCLKSGNACILKGGSDADDSNQAIVQVIHQVLAQHGVDPHTVVLLPASREATAELLNARGYVDVLIPRGSSSLINYVREHAAIPVIETGAGVCHVYFDVQGDTSKGASIIHNAKTRRVSVCNALDCVLLHEARLGDLPALCEKLADDRVAIYADAPALQALQGYYPSELLHVATPDSYGTEYLSYAMSVRTVPCLDAALAHIQQYGLKHSECIVTEDDAAASLFQKMVDAACVYVNVSTAFTDGAQFGLGAEIGISTQKLHARGPMGLEELCTYKWLINGEGQVRS